MSSETGADTGTGTSALGADIDVGELPDNLKCVHCKSVLQDACQLPCGCRLCRRCIADLRATGAAFCPGVAEDCGASRLSESVADSRVNMDITSLPEEGLNTESLPECTLANAEIDSRECHVSNGECRSQELGHKQVNWLTEEIPALPGDSSEQRSTEKDMLLEMMGNITREMAALRRSEEDHTRENKMMKREMEIMKREIEIMKREIEESNKREIDESNKREMNESDKREMEMMKREIEESNKREIDESNKREIDESNKREIDESDKREMEMMKREIEIMKREIEESNKREIDERNKREMEMMKREIEIMKREIEESNKRGIEMMKRSEESDKRGMEMMKIIEEGNRTEIKIVKREIEESNKREIEESDKREMEMKREIEMMKRSEEINKIEIEMMKRIYGDNKIEIETLKQLEENNKREIEMLKSNEMNNNRELEIMKRSEERNKRDIKMMQCIEESNKTDIEMLKQREENNKKDIEMMKCNEMNNKREIEIVKRNEESNKREIETLKMIEESNMREMVALKCYEEMHSRREEIKQTKEHAPVLKDWQMSVLVEENKLIKDEIQSIKEKLEELVKRVVVLTYENTELEIVERGESEQKPFEHVDDDESESREDIGSINRGDKSTRNDIYAVQSLLQAAEAPVATASEADAIIEWLIDDDLRTTWTGKPSKDHFRGVVHPYKYRLFSGNCSSPGGSLFIHLLIQDLQHLFRGAVTVTVADRHSPGTCSRTVTRRCRIESAPGMEYSWSDDFKFLHSDLVAAGLNLGRGVRVSCLIAPEPGP